MTKTILVPVEPTREMIAAAKETSKIIGPIGGWLGGSQTHVIWRDMLAAAPKPTIPEDDREEVALAIKHCFDTGKTRFDQITDAAIHTLISLGWKK